MSYRLSAQAEDQLDDIWLYIARESGSVDTAVRMVENINNRFWLLGEVSPHRPEASGFIS